MKKVAKLKSGRKKIQDENEDERVVPVSFYTKKKFVNRKGGMEKSRAKCKKFMEEGN